MKINDKGKKEEKILDRFKIRTENITNFEVKLRDIALAADGVKPLLDNLGNTKYTREELEQIKGILWEVQDSIIKEEGPARDYIMATSEEDVNYMDASKVFNVDVAVSKLKGHIDPFF